MKPRHLALPLVFIAALFVWIGLRDSGERDTEEAPVDAVSIDRTRAAEREEEGPEHERRRREAIAAAAKKWHEELLENFPEMKPEYRDVPDAKNGYLQYLLLLERTGERRLPTELYMMATGGAAWDAAAFKRWLEGNQGYLAEILRVAELPDQSAKGTDLDSLFHQAARFAGEFGAVLIGAARLAAERGDHESALRYTRGALNLSDHLTGIETPNLLGRVIAAGFEASVHHGFRESILPAIADDAAMLRQWGAALAPQESPAEAYGRIMLGEWHTSLRMQILPALLGDESIFEPGLPLPPLEEVAAVFAAMQQSAAQGVLRSGAGRFDVEGALPKMPSGEYDASTLEMLNQMADLYGKMNEAIGLMETRRAMDQAAIAILLGEEPPVDPVSGEAFLWDPDTRVLSTPESSVVDPLVVP